MEMELAMPQYLRMILYRTSTSTLYTILMEHHNISHMTLCLVLMPMMKPLSILFTKLIPQAKEGGYLEKVQLKVDLWCTHRGQIIRFSGTIMAQVQCGKAIRQARFLMTGRRCRPLELLQYLEKTNISVKMECKLMMVLVY